MASRKFARGFARKPPKFHPMAAYPLEIVLSRQLAENLTTSVFITDPAGNLLYYNEQAEVLLGKRFEFTGPMAVEEWSVIFKPKTKEGKDLPPSDLPLVQTLNTRRPSHSTFWIESLGGQRHLISVTSLPLSGPEGTFYGARAIFWSNEPAL